MLGNDQSVQSVKSRDLLGDSQRGTISLPQLTDRCVEKRLLSAYRSDLLDSESLSPPCRCRYDSVTRAYRDHSHWQENYRQDLCHR